MDGKTVKLGILGAGRGGTLGYAAIGEKNVKITAVCDLHPERIEELREVFKKRNCTDFECYSDYEAMLREADIDAVVVASAKPDHVKHCIMALKAGKHVLSEIPTVCSVEEAKLLKKEVSAHPKLIYMTGENCCYWAFVEMWKKMREDGKFGDIVYAEGEYLHSSHPDELPDYKYDPWRSENSAITYITHELGPLLDIMDDRCVSVSCMTPDTSYNPKRTGRENGVAIFKTAKGAVIRIFIGFGAFVGFDHNFALYGTRGSIITDKRTPLEAAHSFAKLYEIPDSMEDAVEIPVALAYPGESTEGHGGAEPKMMRDFIACIREGKKPRLDVDAGIRMSLPGVIADRSSKFGGTLLEIPEI